MHAYLSDMDCSGVCVGVCVCVWSVVVCVWSVVVCVCVCVCVCVWLVVCVWSVVCVCVWSMGLKFVCGMFVSKCERVIAFFFMGEGGGTFNCIIGGGGDGVEGKDRDSSCSGLWISLVMSFFLRS